VRTCSWGLIPDYFQQGLLLISISTLQNTIIDSIVVLSVRYHSRKALMVNSHGEGRMEEAD
jgi:hypothetical protein